MWKIVATLLLAGGFSAAAEKELRAEMAAWIERAPNATGKPLEPLSLRPAGRASARNYPNAGGRVVGDRVRFLPAPGKIVGITQVTLASATPGVWFRYTLDGTPPTRTRGYVYCGVISVRPGMTLKAVAYRSGMADSPVAAAAYPGP